MFSHEIFENQGKKMPLEHSSKIRIDLKYEALCVLTMS